MYLPETSTRYQALKSTSDATIEISPESLAYLRDLAERIGGADEKASKTGTKNVKSVFRKEPSGAALIIDYGTAASIPTNSLRGIRAHKRVSPFESPGTTDVSADVDFLGLAEAAINASPGVEVHGPVDQARFLTAMGIRERAAQLVKQAVDRERAGSTGDDKSTLTDLVTRIEGGSKRLIDISPQGMGKLYQVMAILPYLGTREKPRRPVGFGGDITS
ncbi:hypothetical protein MRB53_040069 [Persea americana]|nr:hypothetical protein MRB53_040069 [Persea americana]